MVRTRRSAAIPSSPRPFSISPVSSQSETFADQALRPNPWFYKREGAFERIRAYRHAIEQLNDRLKACQFHPDCREYTRTTIATRQAIRNVINAGYDHQRRWKQKTGTEMWGSEEWQWLFEEWQDFLELVHGLELLRRYNSNNFGSNLDEVFRYARLLDECVDKLREQDQKTRCTSS